MQIPAPMKYFRAAALAGHRIRSRLYLAPHEHQLPDGRIGARYFSENIVMGSGDDCRVG